MNSTSEPQHPTVLLRISRLQLRLGRQAILRDISLEIRQGEYLSLVGPNGAGKTSLLKCLGRLQRGWQGCIQAAGRDLRHCTQRETARLLSYVPQATDTTIPFTCLEFVLMARYPHLSPFTTLKPADRALADEALVNTGTRELRHRRMDTLSGGERQMIMIAAALAQGAQIMLLDEPAAFLDYRHQQQIFRLLGELNRSHGTTIIAVSHDINSACRWSHRVAALRDGRLLFCRPAAEVLHPPVLHEIYNTEFVMARTPAGRQWAALEDGA
ncbi:MAG: ABC transporter ATP-binding protein [Kiritimatiellia bacterium]